MVDSNVLNQLPTHAPRTAHEVGTAKGQVVPYVEATLLTTYPHIHYIHVLDLTPTNHPPRPCCRLCLVPHSQDLCGSVGRVLQWQPALAGQVQLRPDFVAACRVAARATVATASGSSSSSQH